ncbi:MAG: hypothetical protein AAGF11_10205 [Myxococcota bacterium]
MALQAPHTSTTATISLLALTLGACVVDDAGRSSDELDRDNNSETIEQRIVKSIDDVEQKASGTMYMESSDLELVNDEIHDTVAVGLRFPNLDIPHGATIERAYIQFSTDEVTDGEISLNIRAQRTGSAPQFSTSAYDLSSREVTSASVTWQPAAWPDKHAATDNERTPDLDELVQEVVDLNGWQAGNDLVFIVTGNGRRTAESYDGSPSEAPLLHIEFSSDGSPPDDDGGGGDGGGGDGGGGGGGGITHIGTTETYDSNGQDLSIDRPSGSQSGDLLLLFMHRTDDELPLELDGWTRGASCFKQDNGYDCYTADDCVEYRNGGEFCARFGEKRHRGRDLAQAVFYREVSSGEPSEYEFDLNRDSSGHPGWAILTALRGARTNDPIRDWSHEGCDDNSDSKFPSVFGQAGDMVLLSQSFDDAISKSKFNPPDDTEDLGYVSQSDEAGFLFGGILSSTGDTGSMKTHGAGGPSCKDALVSLTVKPQ